MSGRSGGRARRTAPREGWNCTRTRVRGERASQIRGSPVGMWPGVRRAGVLNAERAADAGPAAPLRGAALISYGSIRQAIADTEHHGTPRPPRQRKPRTLT
jgi:hypothetical protein